MQPYGKNPNKDKTVVMNSTLAKIILADLPSLSGFKKSSAFTELFYRPRISHILVSLMAPNQQYWNTWKQQ